MSTDHPFLIDLLSTPSPTGFEVQGQRKWANYVRSFADKVENDAYGSAWATIQGTNPKAPVIMLEAHADEIGYMVKHISKDGFLFVDRVGGSDVATARGRRVDILGDKGSVRGVIGNIAIHIRDREDEKVPKVHELWVDIGATSDAEVKKAGIRVGHPLVYADSVETLGNHRLMGRALANRIGGYIITQVLSRLAKAKTRPSSTVIGVNAVQEEIGGHGARMVAHRLMPAIAIVLDVTHATDTPDNNPPHPPATPPNNYPNNYPARYPNKYPDRYPNQHPDKYADRYPNKYPDRYSDRYTYKYSDEHANKYADRYPNKYSD